MLKEGESTYITLSVGRDAIYLGRISVNNWNTGGNVGNDAVYSPYSTAILIL